MTMLWAKNSEEGLSVFSTMEQMISVADKSFMDHSQADSMRETA